MMLWLKQSIQMAMLITSTMMLHAATLWSDVANAKLWPLAVKKAVVMCNHTPEPTSGLSPHNVFTKMRWPHSKFQNCHVWG